MEASYDDADDDNDADDDEEDDDSDDDGNDDGMLMSLSDEYTSTKRLPSRTLRLFFLFLMLCRFLFLVLFCEISLVSCDRLSRLLSHQILSICCAFCIL